MSSDQESPRSADPPTTGKPVRDTTINRRLTFYVLKRYGASKERWLGRLCTLPFGIIIKTGSTKHLHLSEANTMQFVAKSTNIPVPKVYCAFIDDGSTYIVMQKLEGEWLGSFWARSSEEQKKKVLASLKDMMDELRALRPPVGCGVQNVVGGALADDRIISTGRIVMGVGDYREGNPNNLFGPFPTVAAFQKWQRLGTDAELQWVEHLDTENEPYWVRRRLRAAQVLEVHRKNEGISLKFTHGDLNQSNVLVSGDRVVGIIDWGTAGWYPAYWEYAMTVCEGRGATCHPDFASNYLDEYMEEARAFGEFLKSC